MNRCVVLIIHSNGFGDQYESILTAYNTVKEIENAGYNVEVGCLVHHNYFSCQIPMSVLFDYSPFQKNVTNIPLPNHQEHPLIKGLKKLPQTGDHIRIYVSEIDDYFKSYTYKKFDKSPFFTLGNDFWLNKSFIKKEILDSVEKLYNHINDEFYVGHIRCNDEFLGTSMQNIMKSSFWAEQVEKMENFVLSNSNKKIMICSQNQEICSYFEKKYKNVFCNDFTHKHLMMHNTYADLNISDFTYIEHASEILVEMVLIHKARKIYSLNTFLSNFILYGLVYNIHHKDLSLKGDILLL